MSTSIFGDVTIPTALSLGKNMLTIGNGNYKLAVNGLQYQFGRTITPYFTLNMAETGSILITSDPIGSLTLSYIMGASKNLLSFLETFSDVCNIENNSISAKIGVSSKCKSSTNKNLEDELFTFKGCLISNISGNMSRSERGTICIGSITLTFVDLGLGN
jgi:hypothetical protein